MAYLETSIKIKALKQINVEGGNVLHALKASEKEFHGFEEAYFSTIEINKIKSLEKAFANDHEFNCACG